MIDRIIQGDCLDVMKDIPDKSIDLVLTDPPYGISKQLNSNKPKTKSHFYRRKTQVNYNFGEWDNATFEWVDLVLPKIKGWFCSFCAKEHIGLLYSKLIANEFVGINTCVWEKPNPVPLNSKTGFLNSWESFVVGKRSNGIFNSGYQKNIFKCVVEYGTHRFHPTQKPVDLIEDIVSLLSNENDIILDCFLGSGTTAVACVNLKRHFIGIEKEQEYVDIANKRVAEAIYQRDSQPELQLAGG
jgi:site-specific DNA-methyltransferase (adenine-specific)